MGLIREATAGATISCSPERIQEFLLRLLHV